jgi:hypothetical protein
MGSVAERTRRQLVGRGSIPLTVHGLLEYGAGVLFIVATLLFHFDTDAPKVLSVLIGAGILVLAVVTDSPTGVSRTLPLASHIVLDYVVSIFVIVAPFLFGFTDDGPALAFFLVVGVAYLLMTVMTRFYKPDTRH